MNKIIPNADEAYIISLDPVEVRDSLRYASDETIRRIAKLLTETQYTFAQHTLPLKASRVLEKARLEN